MCCYYGIMKKNPDTVFNELFVLFIILCLLSSDRLLNIKRKSKRQARLDNPEIFQRRKQHWAQDTVRRQTTEQQ